MKKIIVYSILTFLLSVFTASAGNLYVKSGDRIVSVPLSEMDSVVHLKKMGYSYSKEIPYFMIRGEKDTSAAVLFYKDESLFLVCDKDSLASLMFDVDFRGDVVFKSLCKNSSDNSLAANDTAFSYHYNPDTKELLLHVYNQYFDCCHDVFTAKSKVKNDSITISVRDYGTYAFGYNNVSVDFLQNYTCNCICPYDVTYKVKDVDAKKYNLLLVSEAYDLDLSQNVDGFIMKNDNIYAIYFESSSCHDYEAINDRYLLSDGPFDVLADKRTHVSDTLLYYSYDTLSKLCRIHAFDRSFSCCPALNASAQYKNNDTILVSFYDMNVGEQCDCMCYFDVSTMVNGMKEDKLYHFNVDGLVFDVDLSKQIEGCIYRDTSIVAFVSDQGACKRNVGDAPDSRGGDDAALSDTLVSFRYNPAKMELEVVSHNVELNCCTQTASYFSAHGDSIVLEAVESDPGCRCRCLYDVKSLVTNIRGRKYHLVVDGVAFDADFSNQIWGVVLRDSVPTGTFVKSSPCKGNGGATEDESEALLKSGTADTLVSYSYNPRTQEVLIVSYDQELNCCAHISSETSLENGNIVVKTTQEGGICKCLCVYDVTTKISAVKQQPYHFEVDGVAFDVDFSKEQRGIIMK